MSELRAIDIEAEGIRSPGIEAGPQESDEAVFFVHGNPGSSSDWTELVAAAGALGRAVAIDMPGFGRASKPRDFEYHVGSYAAFIESARRQLGIARMHLVLHDFGGPFGLVWGLQHGADWESAVLFNIGVMPGYRWHKMARRWRTPLLGELLQAWIPRSGWRSMMERSNPRGLPLDFVDKMYDEYDRGTRRAVLKLYRATPDPGETAGELGAAIAALSKPALVVWGAKDPFIGVQFAERQREFFDVEELIVLPESGHWPFKDDPHTAGEAVMRFLTRHVARPRPVTEGASS